MIVGALAATLTETLAGIVGLAALLTAVFAATARYIAVLQRLEESEIERTTALGFFVGLSLSIAVVLVDLLA